MLEQLVRALEIASQPAHGGRPVRAYERLLARCAEQLPVHAHEQPGRDPRVALVDAELLLDRLGQGGREPRHHLELLGLQGRRLLDDPREHGEAGAAHARALATLQAAQRSEDRLAGTTASNRLTQRLFARRHLVEEEVFLRREVVEDRLLGDARLGRDLGDGNVVEAALDEEAHRRIRNLPPRLLFLRLAQPHLRIVSNFLHSRQPFSCYNFPLTRN